MSNKKSRSIDDTNLEGMIGDILFKIAPNKQQVRDEMKAQIDKLKKDKQLNEEIGKLTFELQKLKTGEHK